MDLFDEVPEARAFGRHVIDHLDDYLLFPEEKFAELALGVMASTNVDSQGESFALEALEALEAQISSSTLWQSYEHNPAIQNIGRVIAAKVFYAPESKLHFVVGVSGTYDQNSIPTLTSLLEQTPDVGELDEDLLIDQMEELDPIVVGFNPHEIPPEEVEAMLADAPDLVSRVPARDFRKSFDPITVLTVLLPAWFAVKNPFSKKFLDVWGEHAAKRSIEATDWLGRKIVAFVAKRGEKLTLEAEQDYRGCRLQFVVVKRNLARVREAMLSLPEANRAARGLVDRVIDAVPTRLTYVYDAEAKAWLPAHLTSMKHGVLSDRPVLVALEGMSGLSLGGRDMTKKR